MGQSAESVTYDLFWRYPGSYACFISADDKHKVPIGEDVPVSMDVRNKKTLVPAEGEISASDHDFTKLSLTPSVTLFVDIPNNISESFYNGKVYICYKDTVFQSSSALRHLTEFFNLVKYQYQNRLSPTILSLYTDGGPDHRCTFGSVQVALICLFLAGDFDMLIAVRTALHHTQPFFLPVFGHLTCDSWCNPAERVMSVINYGLQDIAIKREKMTKKLENEFENLNTLEDICERSKDNPNLKTELEKCIITVQELLCERIEHLNWKNEAFETENPASDLEINEMFEVNIFIVIKDNPDHYESFVNLYGKSTTEKFRPSLISLESKTEPALSNILVSAKIRDYIKCNFCGKMRCLYSDLRLTEQEMQDLNLRYKLTLIHVDYQFFPKIIV
ncbi:hypothetical protein RhiirB3_451218 [Rhizophagus irregularis]|nr:hypothetical protein RhiirB3_451218 [Rhizophagus irregularis]